MTTALASHPAAQVIAQAQEANPDLTLTWRIVRGAIMVGITTADGRRTSVYIGQEDEESEMWAERLEHYLRQV